MDEGVFGMESLAVKLKNMLDDLRANRNEISHIVLSYGASNELLNHASKKTPNLQYVSEFMGYPVRINMQLKGSSALVYFNTDRAVGQQVRSIIDV